MKLADVCLSQLAQEKSLKSIEIMQAKILQQLFKFEGLGFAELVMLTHCDACPKELSIQLRPLLANEVVIFDGEKYRVKDPWLVLNTLIDEVEQKNVIKPNPVWVEAPIIQVARQKLFAKSSLG